MFIGDNDLGAELLESLRQVLLKAHEKVLVTLVPLSLDKHGASIEVFAKVLSHVTDDRFIEDIAAYC